jgi:hypothetical protein
VSHQFPLTNTRFVECLPARQSIADTGKAQKALVAERDAAVNQLQFAEAKIQELETRLEQDSRESSDMGALRQRISEEMDDERKQYQKDLADRDFTADQTRKKYQGTVILLYTQATKLTGHYARSRACATERRLGFAPSYTTACIKLT